MRTLLRRLARRLEAADPNTVWRDISLVLNDDESMRALNRAWFSRDRVTDTISFRYESVPGEPKGCSAEIFVNVEEAWRQGARRAASSPERELALYVAHGLHHLAGADDQTPARRQAMIRTEWQWVKDAERLDLLDGLFRGNPKAEGTGRGQ